MDTNKNEHVQGQKVISMMTKKEKIIFLSSITMITIAALIGAVDVVLTTISVGEKSLFLGKMTESQADLFSVIYLMIVVPIGCYLFFLLGKYRKKPVAEEE